MSTEIIDAEIIEDEEAATDHRDFTEAEAREHTDLLKFDLERVWDSVTEAYVRGAHRALGYDSWDDYCRTEFGSSRLGLPREERAEAVKSLREAGLSLRAISSATGADVKTVRSDLARVGNSHTSTLGADGKVYEYTVPEDQRLRFCPPPPEVRNRTIAEACGIDMDELPPRDTRTEEEKAEDAREFVESLIAQAQGRRKKTVKRSVENGDTDRANGTRNDLQGFLNPYLRYMEAVGKNLPDENLPSYCTEHVVEALRDQLRQVESMVEWTISRIKSE